MEILSCDIFSYDTQKLALNATIYNTFIFLNRRLLAIRKRKEHIPACHQYQHYSYLVSNMLEINEEQIYRSLEGIRLFDMTAGDLKSTCSLP